MPQFGRCCTSCLVAEELHSNIGWSLCLLQNEQRFEIGYHWNPSLLWIQPSTERWNHVEWKQCILLALMFYRGRSPQVEWKHYFQLVGSSPCQSPLSIATSQSTHCEWTIGSATSCSLYIELSCLMSLLKIPLWWMQQPTEIWKKACHWRIRHCCLRQM